MILPVLENVMQTPAFKQAFRRAMEEAHQSLFTADGTDLVVNLSQSLGVLAGSLQISNPDVAANIPTGLDQLLVDLGTNIRGMELWSAAEQFSQLAGTLLLVSLAFGVTIIFLDRQVRRGVFKVGVAMAAAGTTLSFTKDWSGTPSCAPNRGTPDSPLFQINHWVTPAGSASTVAQAKQVNAYDVLMPRVKACMAERGRFPTIIGVNFATTGDLMKVVDDLNGVR